MDHSAARERAGADDPAVTAAKQVAAAAADRTAGGPAPPRRGTRRGRRQRRPPAALVASGMTTVCAFLPLPTEPLDRGPAGPADRRGRAGCWCPVGHRRRSAGLVGLLRGAPRRRARRATRRRGRSASRDWTRRASGRRPSPGADLVLVPALAVDRPGFRLGRGGGHYDRTLALLATLTRRRPDLVAVVDDDEVLAAVPHDHLDVRWTCWSRPPGGCGPRPDDRRAARPKTGTAGCLRPGRCPWIIELALCTGRVPTAMRPARGRRRRTGMRSQRRNVPVPTYQYACTECDHEFEAFQSFTDAALTECPVCGGQAAQGLRLGRRRLQGSGFYRTDSRNGDGKVRPRDPTPRPRRTRTSPARVRRAGQGTGKGAEAGSTTGGNTRPGAAAGTSKSGSGGSGSARRAARRPRAARPPGRPLAGALRQLTAPAPDRRRELARHALTA